MTGLTDATRGCYNFRKVRGFISRSGGAPNGYSSLEVVGSGWNDSISLQFGEARYRIWPLGSRYDH
jgi:hypothetical protein